MSLFKYELPSDCPKILINEDFQEGDYNIFYFRISQNCPIKEDDVLPQLFMKKFKGRRKKLEKEKKFSALCQMSSLSVLQNKSDAINLMQKFKNIGKYIYKGIVNKEHGLILITPSNNCPTHCSFYSYIEINELNIFNQKVL